jgi:hypothetical protein
VALVLVDAFFDESGSHDGAPILCVAGYLMSARQADRLRLEWNAVLAARKLPYFRMSECAHGNGTFANLTKSERIQVQTRMIQIIKRYTAHGLGVTVNEAEFYKYMTNRSLISDPYTFCAQVLLAGVSSWLEGNKAVSGVGYHFESGHKNQRISNVVITTMFINEGAKRRHRYARHSFVSKEAEPAVQAADLLAWQWYTDRKRHMESKPRRKDCESLLKHSYKIIHIGPNRLASISEAFPNGVNDDSGLIRFHEGDSVDPADSDR